MSNKVAPYNPSKNQPVISEENIAIDMQIKQPNIQDNDYKNILKINGGKYKLIYQLLPLVADVISNVAINDLKKSREQGVINERLTQILDKLVVPFENFYNNLDEESKRKVSTFVICKKSAHDAETCNEHGQFKQSVDKGDITKNELKFLKVEKFKNIYNDFSKVVAHEFVNYQSPTSSAIQSPNNVSPLQLEVINEAEEDQQTNPNTSFNSSQLPLRNYSNNTSFSTGGNNADRSENNQSNTKKARFSRPSTVKSDITAQDAKQALGEQEAYKIAHKLVAEEKVRNIYTEFESQYGNKAENIEKLLIKKQQYKQTFKNQVSIQNPNEDTTKSITQSIKNILDFTLYVANNHYDEIKENTYLRTEIANKIRLYKNQTSDLDVKWSIDSFFEKQGADVISKGNMMTILNKAKESPTQFRKDFIEKVIDPRMTSFNKSETMITGQVININFQEREKANKEFKQIMQVA